MVSILFCYFVLSCLDVILLCPGLPNAIRTAAFDVDDSLHWTTTDFSETYSRGDALKSSLGEDTLDVSERNVTLEVPSLEIFKEVDLKNWTVDDDTDSKRTTNDDAGLTLPLFHLSGAVDVSDMNSSGEGTAENVLQQENRIEGLHSEELQVLMETSHGARDNLSTESNLPNTDVSDVETGHQTSVSFQTFLTASTKEETSLSEVTLSNDSSLSEDFNVEKNTGSENVTLEDESEQDEILMLLNNTVAGNSFMTSKPLHSEDFEHNESFTIESDSVGNDTETAYTGSAVKAKFDTEVLSPNGTESTSSKAATPVSPQTGMNFTTLTPKATDVKVQTVVSHTSVPVNDDATVPSTDEKSTAPEEPLCPAPRICVLWFLARHSCQSDSDCSGSRICCRVSCSNDCIDP